MKIHIASDHAGLNLKTKIIPVLKSKYSVNDLGPSSDNRVDYPDYADKVASIIHRLSESPEVDSLRSEIGILICGSGQGMCIRANKYQNVRAALCWNHESTALSREHNNANILCIGARLVAENLALEIVELFLTTNFAGDRHSLRVKKTNSPL
jgi:ribose 5-phosphate isomerase B